MDRLRGVVQKERLAGRRAADVRLEELPALLEEDEVHLLQRKIRGDDALAAVVGVGMLGQRPLVDLARRRNRHAVTFDERVKPVRRGAAGRPEEAVETVVQRSPFDAARVVHALDGLHTLAVNRLAVAVEERQSDVPFADAGCGITLGAEHGRQRESSRRNERRAADAREDRAPARDAEGHLPRHQAVACGRANGGRAVGINEPHPLARQTVDVRRGDLGPVVVAAHVAVAQVVGKNQQEIGARSGRGVGSADRGQRDQQQGESREHGLVTPFPPRNCPEPFRCPARCPSVRTADCRRSCSPVRR